MYNKLNQTTAYIHNNNKPIISKTESSSKNKNKSTVSETLTMLEEYDLRHFGKTLDEPRYYQIKKW